MKLNSILQTPFVDEYEVLTGEHTLQKVVSGITIMDTYDIKEWLNPHEILIIGNFFLDGVITKDFLLKLHQKKCSGIVTKEKFKKYINDDLLIYSRNLGLPIIVFSDKLSWNDIMSPINLEIVRSQNRELQLADRYNYIMVNSVFKSNSFKGICDQISNVLKSPIALVDEDFQIIDSSNNLNWEEVITNLDSRKESKIYLSEEFNSTEVSTFHLVSENYENAEVLSYTLDKPSSIISRLIIYVPVDFNIMNVSFHLKIENFLHILSIKEEMYKQSFNDFLWHEEILINKMLNYSQISEQSRDDIEFATGKTIKESYYVITIENKELFQQNNFLLDYSKNKNSNKPFFRKFLLFRIKDKFIGFLPPSEISIEEQSKEIAEVMKLFYSKDNFFMGISRLKKIENLKRGLREAEEALELTSTKKKIVLYNSLGFLRLLTDSNGQYKNEYYYELMEQFVRPLIELDETRNSELLKTITAYFENNQAINSTADYLYIHKNTLRSRLKRIYSLLDVDCSNSDHMLNLQVALKIYQTTQNVIN